MKNKDRAVTVLTKGIEFLFKKNKIAHFKGLGVLKSKNEVLIIDENKNEKTIEAEKIIISSGSEPISFPGTKFDEQNIVSSTGALSLKSVPKKLVIIGGGYIGLEMGSVWSRLGSEVHVVEFLDHITPGIDREVSREFMKILQKQGIKFHLETKVSSIKKSKDTVIINSKNKDGKEIKFDCDVVLISVGRKPKTTNLNLENVGVKLNSK